ncbi:MAG: hypothetical protein WC915_02120 [archaeon]|jgi:hypothetical protein
MNKKALAFLLICTIVLLLSFIISFFIPMTNFIGNYPLTILTLLFFFFGVIGFGFISFIPHALLGLSLGSNKNALIFLYAAPIMLATYAGLKFGSVLLDDFNNKKYFLTEIKPIITFVIIAIVLSLVIELALPIIISGDLWPKDLFGMTISEGDSITDLFTELKSLQ